MTTAAESLLKYVVVLHTLSIFEYCLSNAPLNVHIMGFRSVD